MDNKTFWKLIEDSKRISKDIYQQIEILTLKLSQLDEQQIIDFEYRFREALDELNHFSVLAAAKIIQGYVSDDTFLYFRCGLLAHGRSFMTDVLSQPDHLIHANVENLEHGEGFLYISDDAFIRKFGQASDKIAPRDIAADYFNYNAHSDMKGEDWKEEDLPSMYPKLWEKYGKDNPTKHAIDELILKCFGS